MFILKCAPKQGLIDLQTGMSFQTYTAALSKNTRLPDARLCDRALAPAEFALHYSIVSQHTQKTKLYRWLVVFLAHGRARAQRAVLGRNPPAGRDF